MGHIPSAEYDPAISSLDITLDEVRNALLAIDVADVATLAAQWKPKVRLYEWSDVAISIAEHDEVMDLELKAKILHR